MSSARPIIAETIALAGLATAGVIYSGRLFVRGVEYLARPSRRRPNTYYAAQPPPPQQYHYRRY